MEPYIIGIDIGGTKIKAGLVAGDGRPATVIERPTPQENGSVVMALLGDVCEELIAGAGGPVAAVGVGSAGVVNPHTGIVQDATENIKGWMGTAVKAPLQARLNLPVAVDNDLNVFALGEMTYGAGRGYNSTFCVAVGTGIGAALVINGDIWTGKHYRAGEIGYFYAGDDADGQPRLLEEQAGGRGMERIYQQRMNLPERPSLKEIARRAREDDDAIAHEVITRGARMLGYYLSSLVTTFDPDVFILGGGVPQIGPLWLEPFTAALHDTPLDVSKLAPLKPAELGTDAVMLGAVALAKQALA